MRGGGRCIRQRLGGGSQNTRANNQDPSPKPGVDIWILCGKSAKKHVWRCLVITYVSAWDQLWALNTTLYWSYVIISSNICVKRVADMP